MKKIGLSLMLVALITVFMASTAFAITVTKSLVVEAVKYYEFNPSGSAILLDIHRTYKNFTYDDSEFGYEVYVSKERITDSAIHYRIIYTYDYLFYLIQ